MKVSCFAVALLSASAPFVASAHHPTAAPLGEIPVPFVASGPGGEIAPAPAPYFDYVRRLGSSRNLGPTMPTNSISALGCFSEVPVVQVENQGSSTMKDLKVGDKVLTKSGAYETVYAWGHKNPTHSAEFLQFHTANSNLEMTAEHLVFLEGKTNPVRADSVKVGDVLKGDNNSKVTKIKTVERDGVYTPLTPSGTVVVDGIVASSYISLQKKSDHVELQGGIPTFMSYQDFIHTTLSPFRMLCMGVSSSFGNMYTEEGVPLYTSYGMDFLHWANNQNIVIQALALFGVVAVTGAFMVVEYIFGASAAPLAMAAGAGAYYAMMKNGGLQFRANKIKSV